MFTKRYLSFVLFNAVKSNEKSSLFDDSDFIGDIRTACQTTEECALERARRIAEKNGLSDIVEKLGMYMTLLWVLLGFLIILITCKLLDIVLGHNGVINPPLAVMAVLGLNFVSIFIWAFFIGFADERNRLIRYALFIVEHFPRFQHNKNKLVIKAAKDSLQAQDGLTKWLSSVINHAIWVIAFVILIVVVAIKLSFDKYDVGFSTTILSTDSLTTLIHVLGFIPSVFSVEIPPYELSLNSTLAGDQANAWSRWVLWCLVIYGFLLRLILFAISYYKSNTLQERLALDSNDLYTQRVFQRCKPPRIVPSCVICLGADNDQCLDDSADIREQLDKQQIVMFALNLSDAEECERIRKELEVLRPRKILLVCHSERQDIPPQIKEFSLSIDTALNKGVLIRKTDAKENEIKKIIGGIIDKLTRNTEIRGIEGVEVFLDQCMAVEWLLGHERIVEQPVSTYWPGFKFAHIPHELSNEELRAVIAIAKEVSACDGSIHSSETSVADSILSTSVTDEIPYYYAINVIKESAIEIRKEVVIFCFKIVYADKQIRAGEENLMQQICDELKLDYDEYRA